MTSTTQPSDGLQKLVCIELQELGQTLDRADSKQDVLSPETYRRLSRYAERLMRPHAKTVLVRQLAQTSPALRDILWNLMFEAAYQSSSILLFRDMRQPILKKEP